ncbi:Low temperature viability protein-domain-containing protein [Syncephalastrum racemosum]|uniref:Low temperature viability protein-domain-containing protein n=1 Tax=Syncephalastrum racemosum TaxID=13706 RepID=A0A1X2HDW2_SYNRA|nr:Low temperature viability protein-domain-containing protein [Syncephalastrum racemosum]
MGKKPFIDRKEAKHYHVVHRSQRDPLINDNDAGERVLKEYIPGNVQKHKSSDEIERVRRKPVQLDQDEIDRRMGQAATYGIYFDDAGEYDYTQHLRVIGQGGDTVFLEAPQKEEKKPALPKKLSELAFRDDEDGKKRQLIEMPAGVLPSDVEMKVGLMNQGTGQENGLQPDMDPRLREILEALEDEEYIDEETADDDFFGELNADGEEYVPEEEEEEYYEEEVVDDDGNYDWQAAFRNFKRDQRRNGSDDEFEEEEERFDRQTVGTGFSVTSSIMHRNKGLSTLDDRFDKIEEEYGDDDDDDAEEMGAAGLLEDRDDFDDIVGELLDKKELVGKKMQPRLEGGTAEGKLDTLRSALMATRLDDEIIEAEKAKKKKSGAEEVDIWARPTQQTKAWDCQTVLSTYSNLENHPQLISDRGPRKKIVIDPKTGMPSLVAPEPRKSARSKLQESAAEEEDSEEEEEEEDEEEEERANLGVPRSKKESKEEKKARKAAVKEAKKNRRETKKSTKQAFKSEETRQRQILQNQRKSQGVKHIN